MAERRRLQGEIDRTLKKVHDGRDTFKETLDKFESATNQAQKEKHEADLKKEIKKLQRFRDTIKNWLQSGEVKDTGLLIETRKLIENDMERFKVIEKETKTKAYSKEGLFSDQKKDPLQKEKDELLDWLRMQISKLQKKAETCDFDIHNINAKKKRNADRERLCELSQRLSMYRSHIAKQETLLRLLDNDKIELEKVCDLRFSFEEFMSNPDQELYKNDQGLFMYEEMNLDQLSADLTIALDLDACGKELGGVLDTVNQELVPVVVVVAEETEKVRAVVKERVPSKAKPRVVHEPPRMISMTATPTKSSAELFYEPVSVHGTETSPEKECVSVPVVEDTLPPAVTVTVNYAAICGSDNTATVVDMSEDDKYEPPVPTPAPPPVPNPAPPPVHTPALSPVQAPPSPVSPVAPPPPAPSIPTQSVPDPPPVPPPQITSYYDHVTPSYLMPHKDFHSSSHMMMPRLSSVTSSILDPGNSNTFDMILEPGDAMSPFRNHNFQLNEVYNNQLMALEHGRTKLPMSTDAERARMIIHKNETIVPDYFPRDPAPGTDTEEYYMRLDSDTLFFIFYYFEGTRAQFLAAKALKRMSWRFHTGHMCWFQRHEEPRLITDNSESGTYIFYDFESMSRQKKENFTFSYNYLEDKDL